MSENEGAAPAPKRPGRPRRTPPKEALAEALVAEEAPEGEAVPHPPKHAKKGLDDDRIGESVGEGVEWLSVGGKEFRCEDGVIVERVA